MQKIKQKNFLRNIEFYLYFKGRCCSKTWWSKLKNFTFGRKKGKQNKSTRLNGKDIKLNKSQ